MSLQQLRDLLKRQTVIYAMNPSADQHKIVSNLSTEIRSREIDIPQIRENAYKEQAHYTKWALIAAAVFTVIFFAALAYLSI